MPPPSGLEILAVSYQPGREWRIVFHLKGSPEDIDAIVNHEKLELLKPGSPQFKTFQKFVYARFKRPGFPSVDAIQPTNAYEHWEIGSGVSVHLLSNEVKSEVFLLKQRH